MTREEAAKILMNEVEGWGDKRMPFASYITALRMGADALRSGWVRTADRVPEGAEHVPVLGLYQGKGYLMYDIVQIGWLRLHPEMYPYWTNLPQKPETAGVEGTKING